MIYNVTVLSSGKGGSGVSTVTAGLACALALRGEKTIVLDLNPIGGGPAFFLDSAGSPFHLGDVAAGRCKLLDTLFPVDGFPGLSLTLPPPSSDLLPDEATLVQWLILLTPKFDQILLDVPAWNPCFAAMASRATRTLLITNPDFLSVAACDRLRTAPMGQTMQNPRLVLNQFHRHRFFRLGEFPDLDAVIDACGVQLMAVLPTDQNLPRHLPETMRKTLDYDHQPFQQKINGGAIALHCLAERLLGKQVPLRKLDWL